jgi:hypothetical protein
MNVPTIGGVITEELYKENLAQSSNRDIPKNVEAS